jgi:hypothetical protein
MKQRLLEKTYYFPGMIASPAAAQSSGGGVGNRARMKVLDLNCSFFHCPYMAFTKEFYDLFLMLSKKERAVYTY